MRIALDAMGGDFAPARPVAAAIRALHAFPHIKELILVGDESRLRDELKKNHFKADKRLRIHHCTQVVEMTDHATEAVRRKKDSSISRAVELVKDGKADAVVSAGHTGALVACATIRLRNLPGVDRAGIATVMPSGKGVWILLDAGASVDAKPEHLVAYAVMGSVFYRQIIKVKEPRVGLLSNGTEEVKGNELTREVLKLLKKTPVVNFVGYVEGHGLYDGNVEVVICDGFVGNIVLKASENLAKSTFKWLKEELERSPFRMAGAWLARNAFRSIKKRTNADEYGGALLLGVDGICIKAHGSASVQAIVNSIRVAAEAVDLQLNPHIVEELSKVRAAHISDPSSNAVSSH
jgi:glycerol-3-phosphate acyltransferase PlsX